MNPSTKQSNITKGDDTCVLSLDQEEEHSLKSITLRSQEKELIAFDIKYVKHINVLWTAIQAELNQPELEEPLDVNVPIADLKLMLSYFELLDKHNSTPSHIPKPAPFVNMYQNTSNIEADFIEQCWTNQTQFFSLIRSCDFLDCACLHDLALCKLKCIVKSYPLDMLHKVINLQK